MGEQILEGIQALHTHLNDELQLRKRSLQQKMQAQLRPEHEQQAAEVQTRLALQSSQLHTAVQACESRMRAEIRAKIGSQLRESDSKLQETRSWTQEHLSTGVGSHDESFEANRTV